MAAPQLQPNLPGGQMLALAAPPTGINAGGSFYPQATQTGYEKQAGVDPLQYASMLDSGGQLKTPFQYNPSNSSAFTQLKGIAQDTSNLSPWAALQQQQLGQQTQGARDASNTSALGATTQAMQQLQTTGGGVGGGAALHLAEAGGRNATMANQNILNQQLQGNLSIAQGDAQNKQSLLGQVANTETGAQAANTQTGVNDLSNQNNFNANRYTQQLAAWGANQTANAQAAAAKGGKGK